MIILKLCYFFMNPMTLHLHFDTGSVYIILKLKLKLKQETEMLLQFLEKKHLQHFDSFLRNYTYNSLFFEKHPK